MRITNKTTAKQTICPGVIQLTELIQMNCHELEKYLLEQAMENPAIDIDSLYSSSVRAELFEKVQWLNSFGCAPEQSGPETSAWTLRSPPPPLPPSAAICYSSFRFWTWRSETRTYADTSSAAWTDTVF